jgi:hypothetical protein
VLTFVFFWIDCALSDVAMEGTTDPPRCLRNDESWVLNKNFTKNKILDLTVHKVEISMLCLTAMSLTTYDQRHFLLLFVKS